MHMQEMAMKNPIPEKGAVHIGAADVQPEFRTGRKLATKDKDVIRQWAAQHRAEPATGEATASGPATIDVNDGGAGIRFNFPGTGRFRPISWEEWFDNFDRHHLIFVYEENVAERAYELWQRRGGGPGKDQEDWFEAERQLGGGKEGLLPANPNYRLVTDAEE
jgi:DUF2934 family protein